MGFKLMPDRLWVRGPNIVPLPHAAPGPVQIEGGRGGHLKLIGSENLWASFSFEAYFYFL